ncbi:MAG: hypothetical protein M9894_10635 [Planctomycetes bacterium]|nr:hypothetical protein [Planctomycetota bacterium]
MNRASLVVASAAVGAAAALLSTALPSRAQSFGQKRELKWERLNVCIEFPPTMAPMAESQRQELLERLALHRSKVPGGWMVMTPRGGLAFYPDPQHTWDGNSLR